MAVLFAAVYVFGAIVSGLFTGGADYVAVEASENMDRTGYRNWLGGAGAHIAFGLSRQGLGMGALALPVWLFLVGWRWLTDKPVPRAGLIFRFSLLGMLVLPWAAGFVAHLGGWMGQPGWDHWVGASGHVMVEYGLLYLGAAGSGIVLLAITGAISAYYLQPVLGQIKAPKLPSLRDWFQTDSDSDHVAPEAPPAERRNRPAPTPGPEPEPDPEGNATESWRWEVGEDEERVLDEVLPPEPEDDPAPVAEPKHEEQKEDLSDVGFEVHLADEEEQLTEAEINRKVKEFGEYDPTLELSRFQFPTLELLVNHGDGKHRVSKDELEANKDRIEATLANFKIDITKITAEVGPTVTLYEIVPAPGVRISKIKNLEDDIALSLSALGIRIIAPIPGRGTIGIEVPNSNPDVVSMKALIASERFQGSDAALPVAIGKSISNETYVFDLAKMPHLLMAGATGQGKSVGLNAMLVSLLYRKHPSQLKFVLVDPKKVELTLFNHIERHYLAKLPDTEDAIITDTSKVVATLNSLCIEMDQRYDLLKDAQCRNIKEYNHKFTNRRLNPEEGHRYLPYIVLVVDEFADLIMTAGKEVETPIARLAQLARAIGIHLIIATQRPSVNIITGTIKANFPARIAFRVTSKIDSRTILDAGGADQLIGRGDMLLSTGNDLIRLQCGFVDTPEVENICEFIGSQQGYPDAFLLPEYTPEGDTSEGGIPSDDERDDMFEDAARVLVMHQQGSTSLLQRKLKLGYNRAGRIMDQLEAAGIIGPFEGSKARKVLVPDEASLEQMLRGGDA